MKVKYLGTAAAEAVPAMFCNCDFCEYAREKGGKELRFRNNLIIDGELMIDINSDTYAAARAAKVDLSAVKNLLITHTHSDHFMSLDLNLRRAPYAHKMKSESLDLWGNINLLPRFSQLTANLKPEDINMKIHTLKAFEKTAVGDYFVTALAAAHKPDEDAFMYMIEKGGKAILHLMDSGDFPDATKEFFKATKPKVDLITFDCTMVTMAAKSYFGHMGFEDIKLALDDFYALDMIKKETKLIATHFSHNAMIPYDELEKLAKKYNLVAAYDGMEVEF